MSGVIETHGLTKTYGKDRGIKDVDLTVNEGKFSGFSVQTARARRPPYVRSSVS